MKLMSRLFDNLWVKIAALILAILLWFHVATDKTYQQDIMLPLTQIQLGEDLVLVDPPPDSVEVMVSASGKMLLRTDWKKKGLRLIPAGTRVGRFKTELSTANLTLVKADKVALIDVLHPREIIFNADRKVTKEMPVRSRVVITPDEGYAVSINDSVVPGTIMVTGAKKQMESVTFIETQTINLKGVRNDFSKLVALAAPDIYGLTFEPDSVNVYVKVVPVKRRVFPGVAVRLINAPEHRQLAVTPGFVEVRVAGRAGAIDSLNADLISAIADYILADSSGMIPVQVMIPPTISVLYNSADSVRIVERK